MSMTTDTLYELAPLLTNYRRFWQGWGGSGSVTGPLQVYRSGAQYPRLNGVTHNEMHPNEIVADVRQRMAGVPWLWEVTAESHPRTREALGALRAPHYGAVSVMAMDLTRSSSYARPDADTGVREWERTADATEWVEAYAGPMEVPEAVIPQIAALDPARRLDDDRLIRFGYTADGAIRATAEMLITADVAGIYLVATQEAYRQRGVATAVVAAAVARARSEGLPVATLQSNDMAEPVYRRLGFEKVSEIQVFGPPTA